MKSNDKEAAFKNGKKKYGRTKKTNYLTGQNNLKHLIL